MFDSHCHLNDERFENDLHEVLARAQEQGVRLIIIPGYDLPSSQKAVCLANQYTSQDLCLLATVGVSPHESASWDSTTAGKLQELLCSERVVAVGEIGLDYYYEDLERSCQQKVFRAQLELAIEHKLPAVFHLREAADDFFVILDQTGYQTPGILHCFTGDETTMREGIRRGLYVSFSGIVTFKNASDLRAVASQVRADRLLIETDSPYLAPVPYRGKRCEPAYVVQVAEEISRLRGESVQQLDKQLESNLARLFPVIKTLQPHKCCG